MDFLVIGRDGTDADAAERRRSARARHLALANSAFEAGEWLSAAAILDESDEMVGSLITCRFASRADLDAWLETEPYVVGDVWRTIEVIPIRFPGRFAKLHDLRRVTSALKRVPGEFSICRLAANSPPPAWISGWYSLTSTHAEVSVVCESECVPEDVQRESGFALFSLEGPIPFETTGVIASLSQGLAAAEIGVLVVSSFDTDHLLLKTDQVDDAVRILRAAGATIRMEGSR